MPTYNMRMTLEYAQLFPENMDKGNDANDAGRKAASMGGKYKVNAYLTSQEQYDKLIADGLKVSNLGHARFKDGNSAYGIGRFINLHRYQEDVKKFKDKKTGGKIEIEAGGPPKVWDLRNGADNKTPWDFDVDGAIGNGSEAIVKFSTYKDGAGVRLDAVGILVHVPYDGSDNASNEDNWDETVVSPKAPTVAPTVASTVASGKTTDKAFHDDDIAF